MTSGADVQLRGVAKRYTTAAGVIDALSGVTLRIGSGETVAITGPSGCGKSTLLALIAGLDVPSQGTVTIDGSDVSSLDAERRAAVRRHDVGLIFQSDNLLPFLTANENVEVQLALRRGGENGGGEDDAARGTLARAGLLDETERVPDELSGGQRQRVAVARALSHRPRLLVADEPTGSLDPGTANGVVDLILQTTSALGTTLVLVTHERSVAERLGRVIALRDGRVVGDDVRRAP